MTSNDRGVSRSGGVLLVVVVLVSASAVWAWTRSSIGSLPLSPDCTATASGNSTDLDPGQAGNAAIIAAISVQRNLPARAASIAIATAIQESKLRNLNYGDRDSLGLFQQRPSQGWGTKAQILDPVHATNAFFDALVKIHGYQTMSITAVAQRVQHSAYPTAYADHEPQARILASALVGYSPAALTCTLDKVSASPQPAAANGLTARAKALVTAAGREAGQAGTAAGTGGRTVAFTLAGTDRVRLSWSVAQWAVARADGLDVVAVQVGGKQWRRDHPKQGWTTLSSGPPAGTVTVVVA
jgi:hypothetical protein